MWLDIPDAVQYGTLHDVMKLVNTGADLAKGNQYGDTALHIACLTGNAFIVEHLVSKGADVSVSDSYANTALQWADSEGNEAIVMILDRKDIYETSLTS